ncbi:protein TRC8 homolog isoform X2 [Onthophagus taurus]|uniref:protein TRC8 homolog isoform X2 n=1 Tax=Onthophagus taurus TaxID=166361 RepID=UPI000C1FD994|nr:protein TRC8 homolog isoform X1 [Onthophagus taurus]
MSLRAKILSFGEILLRVPSLFVIDEILKISLGLPNRSDFAGYEESFDYFEEKVQNITALDYDPNFKWFLLASLYRLLISTSVCAVAICLFVLSTKHLMIVYMYLMSVGVVFISYWSNMSTMKQVIALYPEGQMNPSILDDILLLDFDNLLQLYGGAFTVILKNYFVQCILTVIFVNIHLGPRYHYVQRRFLPLSFLMPSILALLPVPAVVLMHAPVFAALLPLSLVKFVLWSSLVCVIHTIYNGYSQTRTYVTSFGMSALIESEWIRLNVPGVLRTFWILRVFEHTGLFFISGLWNDSDGILPLFRLIKSLMVTGCDTLTAVLGITSVVSYICHHIGRTFQWFLLTEDENDKSIGTVSAILFYILALQTGLTGLDPEKRFVRLCRNFCLLFTALLHFIHNIVNPLLMSLSASHNPSIKRHLRALAVCAYLVVFPILLLIYLWSNHTISTWLLAVSAFSIEIVVKVAVSLSIYSLFLLDARRETFWEQLDDYVYYIKAFGNMVEFCFGIFLFFNGIWILVYESGAVVAGAIRAVMMCIHAYFNIWCDAKAGWTVFMKRRTAVNKIDSLPEADAEQLRHLDDVCAICYQEMKSAKITRCKHYFHGVCLRKWLYVQDKCPLCHNILHSVEVEENKAWNGRLIQIQVAQEELNHR